MQVKVFSLTLDEFFVEDSSSSFIYIESYVKVRLVCTS